MPRSPQAHTAFNFIRQHRIDSLNITVEQYEHRQTGAVHYHLASENPENVFLVGLRTVPMDHKGVAHILEHTALCGSEKYPVRDPFFMMIRRSLNTFMNAFTSNDWTAYPFASTNRKDFNNLLDVYLDAVFFSRLDELDFLQEGHRLEFSETGNSDSALEYKGVVFNEMKGAMSSVSSTLWQTLCKHLFPSTTYHYNSGGDPAYITDLSYGEMKDFYAKHYHPSNAMFLTFGNIPAVELQQQFHDKALHRFEKDPEQIQVQDEKRYQAPIRVEEFYAFDSQDSCEKQSHIVMSWLLGQSSNLQDTLKAQLISYVLLENSASPLQYYLETSELGAAPSPLCGLEDSYKELVFVCGLAGTEAANVEQFEADIFALLEKIADEGIAPERLDAIVHQLELSQREISGDSHPFGLQLILNALTSVTHRGDPIELLDLDPVLEQLRLDIKDPDYIKNLIRDLFLNNQHRVTLCLKPDKQLSQRMLAAEKSQLSAIKNSLSVEQSQAIIDQAAALAARQAHIDDDSILPKVGLADVPKDLFIADGAVQNINGIEHSYYQQGTNGIVYQQLIFPLPQLSDDELALLPLYSQLLTEVGLGDKSFTEVQDLQSEQVGSISAFCSLRGSLASEQNVLGFFVLSAKALVRNQDKMAQLLKDTLQLCRFDELQRIKDLVSQNRSRKEQSITGSGHVLAMTAACQGFSPLAKLNESWGGISGIQAIKDLDIQLQDEQQLQAVGKKLAALHLRISQMPMQILSISDAEQASIDKTLSGLWQQSPATTQTLDLAPVRESRKLAWLCNTQVNFCAKSYPCVAGSHPDAAALMVLGGFLRNGYLHTAIREKGGAYGAGAALDTNIAAFKFYSYRDPRISGTLADFDAAIDWMLNSQHRPEQLEEAILGVISSLDKPSSPAGEAKQAFHNDLFGRDKAQRIAFRNSVLALSLADLKRVTETYLRSDNASIAVVCSEAMRAEVTKLGLEIKTL